MVLPPNPVYVYFSLRRAKPFRTIVLAHTGREQDIGSRYNIVAKMGGTLRITLRWSNEQGEHTPPKEEERHDACDEIGH